MGDGAVRYREPKREPRGRRKSPPRALPLLIGAAVLGVLTVIGIGSRSGVDEPSPIPEIPPVDDPAGNALGIVREFETAMAIGDVEKALRFFADDFAIVSLPGLVHRPTGGDLDALHASLSFFSGVSTLSLGDCVALETTMPTTHRIRCMETVFSPDYPAATTDPYGGHPWISFSVRNSAITAIADGIGENHAAGYEHYCIWSEVHRPDLAAGVFDARCRPVENESTAAAHAELARSFVAAGEPFPSENQLATRGWVTLVEEFVSLHNQGAGRTAAARAHEDLDPSMLPGFLADTDTARPSPGSFFAWTAALYDIDLGSCQVDLGGPVAVYDCPDAAWSGELLEALDLGTVTQALVFTLADRRIMSIAGATDAHLVERFGEFCQWALEHYPFIANRSMTSDCQPVHTGIGGERLRVLAGWYGAATTG